MKDKGTIISIIGQIVEVLFEKNPPAIHDVLVMNDNPLIKMEVYTSSGINKYLCILFSSPELVYRGAEVINTKETIILPVGRGSLGRIIDLFGIPQDGKGPVQYDDKWSIYRNPPSYIEIST